jgi:hypothetical protein
MNNTELLMLIQSLGGYTVWMQTILLFWRYMLPHLEGQSSVQDQLVSVNMWVIMFQKPLEGGGRVGSPSGPAGTEDLQSWAKKELVLLRARDCMKIPLTNCVPKESPIPALTRHNVIYEQLSMLYIEQ